MFICISSVCLDASAMASATRAEGFAASRECHASCGGSERIYIYIYSFMYMYLSIYLFIYIFIYK